MSELRNYMQRCADENSKKIADKKFQLQESIVQRDEIKENINKMGCLLEDYREQHQINKEECNKVIK